MNPCPMLYADLVAQTSKGAAPLILEEQTMMVVGSSLVHAGTEPWLTSVLMVVVLLQLEIGTMMVGVT